MLIRGDFGELEGLAQQIEATVGRVGDEMATWAKTVQATADGWQDLAYGEFSDVSDAWRQVSQARNEMLAALKSGVMVTNDEFRQALSSAKARVASTAI